MDIQLNQNYLKILLIAVSDKIELFEIPENPSQNEIEKPKFIFKEHKSSLIVQNLILLIVILFPLLPLIIQ